VCTFSGWEVSGDSDFAGLGEVGGRSPSWAVVAPDTASETTWHVARLSCRPPLFGFEAAGGGAVTPAAFFSGRGRGVPSGWR
jgi:hypothetical protein